MTDKPGLALPAYYLYYQSPVKIVETADGGARVWRVSVDSGGWHEKNDIFVEVTLGVGGDIFRRTAEDFVQEVEAFRAYHLKGDGPIFALYDAVRAIEELADAETRHETPSEQAIIRGIRRRTFVMFEEQLRAAGDPGADPDIATA
ncbi:hypothetical protein JOD64_003834 [Micromonospora luteifusca]|uniref:Uncharacterized protein n=1 Tax=Micromonospora luteifusca TaxID=709860 RepID=A0ABS2LWQ6_9ACTN|nr:hypothetical protein [Micromonospora luteifusca]MBM7492612.1 hypothetical protein [Micromonospora luteifusca]